jgi:hypothetical protein
MCHERYYSTADVAKAKTEKPAAPERRDDRVDAMLRDARTTPEKAPAAAPSRETAPAK